MADTQLAVGNVECKLQFKDIYETLIAIEIDDKKQEVMDMDYISWADAYNIMVKEFPQMERGINEYPHPETRQMLPYRMYTDGSVEVVTWVKIGPHKREQSLAVMSKGGGRKSIINPSSREVTDTHQRCFVKTYAMFGLGLSLWMKDFSDVEGEDDWYGKRLPKDAKEEDAKKIEMELVEKIMKQTNYLGLQEIVLDNEDLLQDLKNRYKKVHDRIFKQYEERNTYFKEKQ
tara:strand:- start:901 stop:1593 length:693 start_codon:yes stop_codon:yes gene_type:complete